MLRATAFAAGLVVLGLSGVAAAQPVEGAAALDELVVELGVKKAQLAHGLEASNCAAACEALASMQRAADRICELEPGPRCDAAKRDVDEARQRVSAACPECLEARREGEEVKANQQTPLKPGPAPDRDDDGGGDAQEKRTTPMAGAAAPTSAPPAEDARGCAACAVGGEGDGGQALGWLGLGLGLLVARRRRRG